MIKFVFWLSISVIFYTYIGYPLLITFLAKRRKRAFVPKLREYPKVSVIIPVYNEEDVLERKINNCLNVDYPYEKIEVLVGSDGSTDRTNDIIMSFRDERIKYIISKARHGKPTTINKLVDLAEGKILFFTDARQMIEKEALKTLVRNFRNPKIGSVSGELVYERKRSITARSITKYWDYEKHIREMESKVYSMIGATGAIFACRKDLFETLPEDIILDDVYTPLQIVSKGFRAIFDREARAYDVHAEIPHEEYKRKVRTLSGNYQIFFKMPHMLNPFKSKLALQIISHKLLRVLAPFFMLLLFFSNFALATKSFYDIIFMAQGIFYIMAIIEAISRRHIKRIFGIPYMFCLLNFSAVVGLWNYIFNKADIKWEKARTS